jgi:flotillin
MIATRNIGVGEADANKARGLADVEVIKARGMTEADVNKAKGLADADVIRARGMTEAEVIKAQGLSEAEAMRRKAEAWEQYTQAAILQFLIQNLPALADAIAQPLAKTEKIVVINSGSEGAGTGATKVTQDVANLLSQMPEVVNALTGIDLVEALKSLPGLKKAAPVAAQPEAEAPAPAPRKRAAKPKSEPTPEEESGITQD